MSAMRHKTTRASNSGSFAPSRSPEAPNHLELVPDKGVVDGDFTRRVSMALSLDPREVSKAARDHDPFVRAQAYEHGIALQASDREDLASDPDVARVRTALGWPA